MEGTEREGLGGLEDCRIRITVWRPPRRVTQAPERSQDKIKAQRLSEPSLHFISRGRLSPSCCLKCSDHTSGNFRGLVTIAQ
jgi:hypothetical protein